MSRTFAETICLAYHSVGIKETAVAFKGGCFYLNGNKLYEYDPQTEGWELKELRQGA